MQPSLFFYSYGNKPQSCHLILNINKQVFWSLSLIFVLHRLFPVFTVAVATASPPISLNYAEVRAIFVSPSPMLIWQIFSVF